MESAFKLYRPTDPRQKAEVFGWDSPLVERALGAFVQKEVGTSITAGPVIRQDLNPEVYEVFVKDFPLLDMIPKRESNGLVDAFERQINYSQYTEDQPLTISETGTVVDDSNRYVQDTCNIAVFGSRRGASLKSIFGGRAGGGLIDVASKEVAGGLLKISHDFQTESFRAQNVTATGAGATTNLGVYDPTGFKGMRYVTEFMTPATNVVQIDVSGTNFVALNDVVTDAISQVANTIMDLGGTPDLMLGSLAAREYLRKEAYAKTRFTNGGDSRTEVKPGVYLPSFTLGGGEDIPYYGIRGLSVGSYSINGDGHNYIDIYIVDSSFLEIVWLGSPTPTLLEIPIGSDATLRKLTIPYWMASLEFAVPQFIGKVRLKLS